MATIDEQIAAIDREISDLGAKKTALTFPISDWQRAADALVCDQRLKSNKDKCNADKGYKQSMADRYRSDAKNYQDQIDQRNITKKALVASKNAENTATVNLSNQGLSNASLLAEANGKAQAAVIQAQNISNAQAKAIESTSETDQTKSYAFVGFVVVVLLVAMVLVIRKLKKRKK